MKTRYFLNYAGYGQGIELRICQYIHGNELASEARPLVFEKVEVGAIWREPTTILDKDSAQSLFDELWVMGFRPERGNITTGQIAATEKHLNDMRALVSSFAKVELPK